MWELISDWLISPFLNVIQVLLFLSIRIIVRDVGVLSIGSKMLCSVLDLRGVVISVLELRAVVI